MNQSVIHTHGRRYCIIDMHNLFVGATAGDELLLLADREDCLPQIRAACLCFGLDLDPDRLLSSYSGGEQAIICCEILLAVLPRTAADILFVHVLETLSASNRKQLLARFAAVLPGAGLFTLTASGPASVSHA